MPDFPVLDLLEQVIEQYLDLLDFCVNKIPHWLQFAVVIPFPVRDTFEHEIEQYFDLLGFNIYDLEQIKQVCILRY